MDFGKIDAVGGEGGLGFIGDEIANGGGDGARDEAAELSFD